LCSKCHDDNHAGKIKINPLITTSKGSMQIEDDPVDLSISIVSGPRSKWSVEQTQCIREYLKSYPNVLPKRAVFDLKEKGIDISINSLRTFRQIQMT
jgi:hypothetical protein